MHALIHVRPILQYHPGENCTNLPSCYKCGKSHLTRTCIITPNARFCGTCKKHGHRTAASNCPLRPFLGNKDTSGKVYRSETNIIRNKSSIDLSNSAHNFNSIQTQLQFKLTTLKQTLMQL